ncbi:hypothetical protein PQX77_013877 [Marasmius sp. AFHP31]|nr:hypothetical protein PQX77_013877 [Marasmius sp. AFHP31]
MTGLAPTLIIVRVGYRQSVDSVQQMVSIHFAECESKWEAGNRAAQSTPDITSCPQREDASSGSRVKEAISEVQEKHNDG